MEAEEHDNVIRKGKTQLQKNAFEKLKLKSSDLGSFWNPEYKKVESGIQKVGIRNPEPLWILLHWSTETPTLNNFY